MRLSKKVRTISNYVIVDGELCHYGVKGMKWGQRKAQRYEARTARKFARAGNRQGIANYYRDKGNEIAKKHNRTAEVFDKQAKKSEAKGEYFKAEASRRAAEAIRARGANQKASNDSLAAYYENRASRITEKASAYATKKRVNLGKKKIDSILSESRAKGYKNAKLSDEASREWELQEKLGDDGYAAYNKIRGRE